MINLIITIFLTSWLLVSFRVFGKMGIDNLAAIAVNYWVCVITGMLYPGNWEAVSSLTQWESWMWMALITGACFLPTFFLMSYTVKNVSVTVATLASKTSLVLPVLVSLLFLLPQARVSISLWSGLVIGLGAIVFSSIQEEKPINAVSWKTYVLPGAVFLGGALVDILINVSNALFIRGDKTTLFPLLAFSASAFTGAIILFFLHQRGQITINGKTLLGGLILGVPNYLSIVFLLKALQDFDNNGAVVFPVLNISVILVNSLVSIFVFKETPGKYLWWALGLAIVSLILVVQNG